MYIVQYSKTNYSDRFKKYLNKEFSVDYLLPDFIDKKHETIFDGWVGKDMGSWYKFYNDTHTLEFYNTTYKIKNNKNGEIFEMPIPLTILNFINDMERFEIPLFWSNWIDINFEPFEYLCREQIIEYFTKLLDKLDKSHELVL